MSSPRRKQGEIIKSHGGFRHSDTEIDNFLIPPDSYAALNDRAKPRPFQSANKPNEIGNTDWQSHFGTDRALYGTQRATSDGMGTLQTQPSTVVAVSNQAMVRDGVENNTGAFGPDAALDMSVASHQLTEELLTKHRFSDMGRSEIKFRDHRDSVAVARSRMSRNGKFPTGPLEQHERVPVTQIDFQDEVANALIAKWEPLISLDPAIMTSPLPMPYAGSTSPLADVTDDIWGFASNTSSSSPRRKLSRGHRHIVIEH